MSAIVSCMFRILSANPSVEVLDLSTKIVQKTQAIRSSGLDIALYDSAKFFVVNGPKAQTAGNGQGAKQKRESGSEKASSGSGTGTNPSSTQATGSLSSESEERVRESTERFQPLVMAVLAAPLEPWRQPERVRKSRVELAVALAQRRGNLQDPQALAAILDPWLVEERSRPLREEIERARRLVNESSS